MFSPQQCVLMKELHWIWVLWSRKPGVSLCEIFFPNILTLYSNMIYCCEATFLMMSHSQIHCSVIDNFILWQFPWSSIVYYCNIIQINFAWLFLTMFSQTHGSWLHFSCKQDIAKERVDFLIMLCNVDHNIIEAECHVIMSCPVYTMS